MVAVGAMWTGRQMVEAEADSYHADAVHFDGTQDLRIASLTNTDAATFAMSFWFKIDPSGSDFPQFWATDPEDTFTNGCSIGTTHKVGTTLSDATFANTFSVDGTNNTAPESVWNHILLSAKTDLSAGNKLGKVYMNDVDVTALTDGNAAFNAAFNGFPFFVMNDTFGHILKGDVAIFWLAPGVSLLDGGGDIPEATRRLFIDADGKPADPSGYPAGAVVFFNGDATAFPTNQGTGGSFTLTNGPLTNASTSPSD